MQGESTEILQADELVITPELHRRRARPADTKAELNAYRELSALMMIDPTMAIQRFLDLALELCPAAGSAALSELCEDANGQPAFCWTAMSGAFAAHVGGSAPRDFSPCGLCLDREQTILVERPARLFDYLGDVEPEVVEGLVVPLYDSGNRPIGTLWVTSHDPDARFDATDARVMEQLAVQLVLAIKLRRKASRVSDLEEAVRDKELVAEDVRHRVKNMIQMTSGLLQLQERGAAGEARSALREAQSRLLVLSSVYETQLDAESRSVDLAALIERLVNALQAASPHGRRVVIRPKCERMLVPVSSAVPIGLIVNEAVTNALKHGYGEDGTGEVVVRLQSSGSTCSLIVTDDGRGFDGAGKESLGMRLMTSLARQLRAALVIDGANGTSVSVEWSVPGEAGSAGEKQPPNPLAGTPATP